MASIAAPADNPAPAGIAAIDAFLADYEHRHQLCGLGPAERRMLRDALIAFVTGEQWLAAEEDYAPLLADVQVHAERALARGAADTVALLRSVALLIEELAVRLALQRHACVIMHEGLVQQGEALKQARLQLPPEPPEQQRQTTRAADAQGNPTSADQASAGSDTPALDRYRVKFWRSAVTADRMSIEVAASSADAARARVLAWGRGLGELTPDEERSETIEREELQDSAFDGLLDPDDPYAVTLLGPAGAD